jgi:hypothetical protein
MLVHVIADYGVGDLAYAEVRQRLALHLPGADVVYTPVPPFDTVSAGFALAQLALTEGPRGRLVYVNVAPRQDDDDPRPGNAGERLVVGRLPGDVLVVAVDAGYALSFIKDEVEALHHVALPETRSQFRSRDAFPPLLPRLLAGEPGLLTGSVAAQVPQPPARAVAYVDGYGNLKTTWTSAPAEVGARVQVRIGVVTAEAIVGGGTFEVPAGALSFAPGSSGWRRRDGSQRLCYELLQRGASAAERFGFPRTGAQVEIHTECSG